MEDGLKEWAAEAGRVSAADLECGMTDAQMGELKEEFANAGDHGLDKHAFVAAMRRILLRKDDLAQDDELTVQRKTINGRDMETLFLRIDVGACGVVYWSDIVSFVLLRQTRTNTVKEDLGGFAPDITRFKGSTSNTTGNHALPITRVLCHRRMPRYFTASEDGTVKSWNAQTLSCEQTVHTANAWITNMLLRSPSEGSPLLSELLLVSTIDRVVSVYDADNGEMVRAFRGGARKSPRQEFITRLLDIPPVEGGLSALDDKSHCTFMQHFRRKVRIEVTQLQGLSRTPCTLGHYARPNGDGEALLIGTDDGALMMYDIFSDLNPTSSTPTRLNYVPCLSYTDGVGPGWWPGHEGPVSALVVANSIESIVSGGVDGTIKLTSLDRGRVLRSLGGRDERGTECGHRKAVTNIAWSDERKSIATCGAERDVFVWNPFIAKPVTKLVGSRAPLIDVAFNDPEMQLVTLSTDSTVRVWDVRTWRCVQLFKDSELSAVAVDKKRRRLLTASSRLNFRTSETAAAKGGYPASSRDAGPAASGSSMRLQGVSHKAAHSGSVIAVIVSYVTRQMVSADDDHVVVWDMDSAQIMCKWSVPAGITSLAFDQGDLRLLVGTAKGDVMVWNPSNATLVSTFTSHKRIDEAGRVQPAAHYTPAGGPDSPSHGGGGGGSKRRARALKKSGCEISPMYYLTSEKADLAVLAGVVGGKKIVMFDDKATRSSEKGYLREIDFREFRGVYSLLHIHPDVFMVGTGVGVACVFLEQIATPALLPQLPAWQVSRERILHGFLPGPLRTAPPPYLTLGGFHGRDEWASVDSYVECMVLLSRLANVVVASRGDGTVSFWSCPNETYDGKGELFRWLAAPCYGSPIHCLALNSAQTLLYTGDVHGYVGVHDIAEVGSVYDRSGHLSVEARHVVKLRGFRAGAGGITALVFLDMPQLVGGGGGSEEHTAEATEGTGDGSCASQSPVSPTAVLGALRPLQADSEPAAPPSGGLGAGLGNPMTATAATAAAPHGHHQQQQTHDPPSTSAFASPTLSGAERTVPQQPAGSPLLPERHSEGGQLPEAEVGMGAAAGGGSDESGTHSEGGGGGGVGLDHGGGGLLLVSVRRDILAYAPDGCFRFHFGVPHPLREPQQVPDAAAWMQTMNAHRRQATVQLLLKKSPIAQGTLVKELGKHALFEGLAPADVEEFLVAMATAREPTQAPSAEEGCEQVVSQPDGGTATHSHTGWVGRRGSRRASQAPSACSDAASAPGGARWREPPPLRPDPPAQYLVSEETDTGWLWALHPDVLACVRAEDQASAARRKKSPRGVSVIGIDDGTGGGGARLSQAGSELAISEAPTTLLSLPQHADRVAPIDVASRSEAQSESGATASPRSQPGGITLDTAVPRSPRRPTQRAATARTTRDVDVLVRKVFHAGFLHDASDFDTRTPRAARPPPSRSGIVRREFRSAPPTLLSARPRTAGVGTPSVGLQLPDCVRNPAPEVTALQQAMFAPPPPAAASKEKERDKKKDKKSKDKGGKEPAPPKEKPKYKFPADLTHGPTRIAKAPYRQYYMRPGSGVGRYGGMLSGHDVEDGASEVRTPRESGRGDSTATGRGYHGGFFMNDLVIGGGFPSPQSQALHTPSPSLPPSLPAALGGVPPRAASPASHSSWGSESNSHSHTRSHAPTHDEHDHHRGVQPAWTPTASQVDVGPNARSPVPIVADRAQHTVYWRVNAEDVEQMGHRGRRGTVAAGARVGGGGGGVPGGRHAARKPPRLVLPEDRARRQKAARFEVVGVCEEEEFVCTLGGISSVSQGSHDEAATARAGGDDDGEVSEGATEVTVSVARSHRGTITALGGAVGSAGASGGGVAAHDEVAASDAELAAEAAAEREWFALAQDEHPPSKRRKQKFDVGSMPLRALTHLDLSSAKLQGVRDPRRAVAKNRSVGVQSPTDDLHRLHNLGF